MKKLLLTLTVTLAVIFGMAQAPHLMNYQGVARNAVGNVLPNKNIALRLSILTGSPTGSVVYSETRNVITNAFGLFTVAVGSPGAINTTGTVAGVNWAQSGTKYLQVEIDPDGGSSFVNVGSTQMLSTPFTFYSNVSGDLILPFTKTQSETGHLFRVTNTGSSSNSSAIEGTTSSNAANVFGIKGMVSGTSPGAASIGVFGQNNGNGSNGIGVMGQHNGNGWGVYGTAQGGAGVYGNSSTGTGLYGQSVSGASIMGFQPTNGSGTAGLFQNTGAGNGAANLVSISNGTGDGFQSTMNGTGKAGAFVINNGSNNASVVTASTNGRGTVGSFQNTNGSNSSTVLDVNTNGTGRAGSFENTNASNGASTLNVLTNGTGDAATIAATGTGKAVNASINNPSSNNTVLDVNTNGLGTSGNFSNSNAGNGAATLAVNSNGTGTALSGTMTGTGKAAQLAISNPANSNNTLEVTTNGTGHVAALQNTNAGNNSNSLEVLNNGTGFAANLVNSNAAPKALRTQGAVQLTGINEANNRVLSTDANGFAKWNDAAAVGIVTGSGTQNLLSKWMPSGTALTNTQIFDDGTNVGMNNTAPGYKLDILATAGDDGLRLRTSNTNNLRMRMVNSTGKEYSFGVGGSTSTFGNGNFMINDVSSSDAVRLLINGSTGNIAIGGGNLTPTEKLWVNGTGRFKNNLDVEKSVRVTDSVNSSRLLVKGNSSDYLAVFENNNTSAGDGIQIKLGKTHPMWDGSNWVGIPVPHLDGLNNMVNQIRDWSYGRDDFDLGDMINLVPAAWIGGTVINLTNYVTDKINTALSLPYQIGPYSTPKIHIWDEITIFGGITMPPGIPDIPSLKIPALDIPAVDVLPRITVMPKIPAIPVTGLPSLEWPTLRATDVNNSLTNVNEFINFADKDGRKLGAIRSQSIVDFSYDYFDALKILQLADQMIGIDLLKDILGVLSGVSEMAVDFNNIGVEYTSGHGDYAEWLQRENMNETISAGDIVAVKGGKITKDLRNAEQIMAVSHKPIVLGNVPEAGKINMGNNVAFMGQIPVKIIGAVVAGDYIVAKGNIPGYGVAVHPKDMTIEDHKLVVGRSWANNPTTGPKAVNTVVGVVNNGFLNILSDLKKKQENTDNRLKAIEESLKMGTTTLKNNKKNK